MSDSNANPAYAPPDDPQMELITVGHDEIEGTAVVARGALETSMAEKGWYEVDPTEAAASEFAGLKKDELVAEAEARGLDTSGTKDELLERLAGS